MTERRSQTMGQPDDNFQQDLHPDTAAEQNDARLTTAYDLKAAHSRLQGYNDDELKQIPVLLEGTRLEQGTTYLDLFANPPKEFKAMGSMVAGQYHMYVPKNETDYQLWNRLIQVDNPERTGDADEA